MTPNHSQVAVVARSVLALLLLAANLNAAGDEKYAPIVEPFDKNRHEARYKDFSKRAANGNPFAMRNLALTYKDEKDRKFWWFRRALDAGDYEALVNLGEAYQLGEGVVRDVPKALRLYEKAAKLGMLRAKHHLADYYIRLSITTRSESVRYRADAGATLWTAGNPYATKAMKLYLTGASQEGWSGSHWLANQTYYKAAELGYAPAMYRLGISFENGEGEVKQNYSAAISWHRKASAKGYALANYRLGFLYEYGRGVKQDDIKSFRWYSKADETGDEDALTKLAYMHFDGRGTERNVHKALKWLLEAAIRNPSDYKTMRIMLGLRSLGKSDNAKAVLTDHRAKYKPKGWAASVLSFLAGEIDAQKLLILVESNFPKEQKERLCEACYYIGSMNLINGDKEKAIAFFELSIKTGVTEFVEYQSARAELDRLKKK